MKLYRSSDDLSVCVSYFGASNGKGSFDNATASATHRPTHWWVDRVFVYPPLRGKGLGKRLVTEMLELVRARGGSTVQVAPGGYNMKYSDQRTFYESCGFTEIEPGLMELTL